MVVTAHFMDQGWKLHKRIISFKKIVSQKGDDLGKMLDSCLLEWGIKNVFTISFDNSYINDNLIEYVKRQLSNQGTLLSGGIYLHMRCAGDILNLNVEEGMKELGASIQVIRNCVKFIHSSPVRLDTFRVTAIDEGLDASSTIGMDVVTRWHSTYTMLKSAQNFKKVFEKMSNDCDIFKAYYREEIREDPPTDDHWAKTSSLTLFLEKFYMATNELSASKIPTSNLVLTTTLTLQALILEKADDPRDKTLQSVAESMKRKFEKHWLAIDELCPIVFIAQALDPRAKFDFLEVLLEYFHVTPEKIRKIKQLAKHHLTCLFDDYKKGSNQDSLADDVVSVGTSAAASIWRELEARRQASYTTTITNEVERYFSDPRESINNETFVLLSWWKLNQGRYPILSMIAKDVFAIPSSSITSNSTFTLGGEVVDPCRAS